jgi:hypothetical protein
MMSQKEVSYKLDFTELVPEFSKLEEASKERIQELVADELIGEIQVYLDAAKSPVSGAPYKTFRKDKKPSLLFEEGDLRDAIEWEPTKKGIKIGVFDKDETPKAFNHNTGDTLPTRRFIPLDDETFKRPIISKIRSLIEDEVSERLEEIP